MLEKVYLDQFDTQNFLVISDCNKILKATTDAAKMFKCANLQG